MDIYVDSCPQNITEVLESSSRLGCGQDKYGNNQYLCVPNTDKTGLIELCYNGIMGLIKRGNCLETDGENLYWNNCLGFFSGCPEKEYRSNEIYQYSACQSINAQHNCYLAESSCPNITLNTTSSNTTLDVQPTIPPPETSHVAEIVGGLVAFLFILAVILILAVVLWRRKKSQKNDAQEHISIEGKELLLAKVDGTLDKTRTPKENRYNVPRQIEPSFHEDDTRDEAKELLEEKVDETFPDQVQRIYLGDYNTWKTELLGLYLFNYL
ncbi:uncharacterized protein LOC134239510 [Saccostrea cucullata]|uniref:uncharacterized protein LOC134239510 n=1 Tax=Saccostrea cuccullata TaxID=36930 RepID=UPI002ED3D5A4